MRGKPGEFAVLGASLFICGLLDSRAPILVLIVATSDFLITSRLAVTSSTRERRALLSASVLTDVGLLALWRFAGTFPRVAGLLDGSTAPETAAVIVPVGLAFFTLRSLGFVIDVYRGSRQPCSSWVQFAAFLTFFPAFVAGPIARGDQLLPQLQAGVRCRRDFLVEGAGIFVQGLAKKMLIADRLATIADPVFANPAIHTPTAVAAGILAYSLQIYCDFAGYSDMAVGVARATGIELPRNFDMPYLATNIGEFWRRWHITLSTWLRDYVFLPIAYTGSRWVDLVGLSRRRGELLNYGAASVITMLLAGLWHGAGWGFVLWGGAHGLALTAHRVWQGSGRHKRRMPDALGCALTFVFVTLAWVPFRAGTTAEAGAVFNSLLGMGHQQTYAWFPSWLPVCAAAVVLGHLLTLWLAHPATRPEENWAARVNRVMGVTPVARDMSGTYLVPTRMTGVGVYVMTVLILSIVLFSPARIGPFVYAAF